MMENGDVLSDYRSLGVSYKVTHQLDVFESGNVFPKEDEGRGTAVQPLMSS